MTFIVRVKREKGNKKIIPQRKRKWKEKKKRKYPYPSQSAMKMSRVKKPRGIKRAKKIVLFSSPCKSIINQFFKSRLKKKRLVNVRVYVIEKLFETHFPIPKYDAKWRGRKPALSSFFLLSSFFFSLCQKSKRSKYRRNDKSNSVACVKKKGFPSFSRRFFPCRFTDQRRNFFPSFPEIEPIELKITDGK